MKYLYKYPQAAYPVRSIGPDQSRAQPAGVRIRTDRHRCLRPGPLLRRVRGIRQGIARRYPGSNQRPQSRPGTRGDSCAAHALVPQSLVLGPGQPAAFPSGRRRKCFRDPGDGTRAGRDTISIAMAGRRCCSPKTKPIPGGCSACRIGPRSSRTASIASSSTDKQDAVNPRPDRHEGRRSLPPDRAAGKVRDGPTAAVRHGAGSTGPGPREERRRVRQTFRRRAADAPAGSG